MLDEDLNVIRPGRSPSRAPAQHIWRCVRWFATLALIPFVIGFIFAWAFWLGMLAFLVGSPVVLASIAISGLVFTVRGVGIARRAGSPWRIAGVILAAPAMTVATLLLAWPSLVAGGLAGNWTKLMTNLHRYEAVIADAQSGALGGESGFKFRTERGVRHVVDYGPPVRVAFNPEGLLDNWSGIIFDPTGEVMLAKGFDENGEFAAPDRVTQLFGGDLVGCRPLWGDYYTCSFT